MMSTPTLIDDQVPDDQVPEVPEVPDDQAPALDDQVPDDQVPADPGADDAEPETFPRAYVEDLRAENRRYRERAKSADTLAARLHTELVRATGRLADPEDLPFDQSHLDDPEVLTTALDALLERKPHLKSRRVTGDVGQGAGGVTADVDLAGILRGLA